MLSRLFALSLAASSIFAAEPLTDAVSVYSNGQWYQDVARAFAGNSTNYIFQWGGGAWTGVAGDWTGDGITKVGAYVDGTWVLDVNNSRRLDAGDLVFQWGTGRQTPVVGDWNGDGITDIGVFSNGNWYLDLNGNRRLDPGESFAWGPANGIPMVGDWNGDKRKKVGSYSPTTGEWILDTNGDRVYQFPTDFYFQWGAPGFIPLVGDFFGLGRDTVGVYYKDRFWLENGDGIANAGDAVFDFGITYGYGTPFVGDWNGDGKAKVGVLLGTCGVVPGTYDCPTRTNDIQIDYDGNRRFEPAKDKRFEMGISGQVPVIGKWLVR